MPAWQVVPVSGAAYTITADFMQVDATSVRFLNGTTILSALLAFTVARSNVAQVHEMNSMGETRTWMPG